MAHRPWPRIYCNDADPNYFVARATDGKVYLFRRRAKGWRERGVYDGPHRGWVRFDPIVGAGVLRWVDAPRHEEGDPRIASDPPEGV
jgi:hypothetical protein